MTKIRSFQMIMIYSTCLKNGCKVIHKINLEVQSATIFINDTELDSRALKWPKKSYKHSTTFFMST